ncbi:MAG: hypothetical protein H6Q65_210 [Firmicutes bacterium]|nr:hypothetical protein [Bacillota bacterium]
MQFLGLIIVIVLLVHYGAFFLLVGGAFFAIWLFIKFLKGRNKPEQVDKQPCYINSADYKQTQRKVAPTSKNGDEYWVSYGTSSNVAGYLIPNGMLYMGSGLAAPSGYEVDCTLIDPKLPVNKNDDDYSIRKTNYWPSYADITPEARASYLHWLSTGKKDPAADIGYVFLYFYGLERRLLHDVQHSLQAKAETEAILDEVARLLIIYGHNGSFNSYANSLLAYLQVEKYQECKLATLEPPVPSNHLGFSMPLRLGLGLMAANEVPVPAEWALSWYCSSPNPPVYTRTAAQRCSEEFGKLFAEEYSRKFGAGIKLIKNKTMISVSHKPASRSLISSGNYVKNLNISDVTVLTNPLNKMAPIVQMCHEKLDSYSRLLGRSPEKEGTLDAFLELPFSIWPGSVKVELEKIKKNSEEFGAFQLVKFGDILTELPTWKDISKKRMTQFLEILDVLELGFEPDLRYGNPVPTTDSYVVLFGLGDKSVKVNFDAHYAVASLSIYLAMVVSNADGDASEKEILVLQNQLERWFNLKPAEQSRLKAHVLWLSKQQLNLTGIKKRIETLGQEQREFVGDLLVRVAQADNYVSLDELKLMERIYRLLGLDMTSLYGKVHAPTSEPVTVTQASVSQVGYAIPAAPTTGGINIDMSKVAMLQADSERVTSILSTIFQGEITSDLHPETDNEGVEVQDDIFEKKEETIWGLNEDLSGMIRILCQKPTWQRAELEELVQDRGMMLEGSLEQINETAFEKHDQSFTDGDDPIEINQEIARVIIQ